MNILLPRLLFALTALLPLLCSAAGAPTPVAPADDVELFMAAPSLRWEPVDEADDYDVQIARDTKFTDIIVTDRTPVPRFVPAKGLEPGIYHWRVAAKHDGQRGDFSSTQRFTILPPAHEFDIPADADADAIRATVAQAATQTPARINFAANATYRLAFDDGLISLNGVRDLEINGNGATLIFTNPVAGLMSLKDCERVTVRNLTIDFDPVPFSVGAVTAVNRKAGTITVVPEPGMPAFDAPHMLKHWTWGVVLDGKTPGRIKTGTPLVLHTRKDNVARTDDNAFILTLTPSATAKYFKPGDKWVQFARSHGGRSLVNAERCRDLAFIGLTNYAISGGHYQVIDSDDAKLLGCRSLIRDGRWMGGNADGVHARTNGIGPWIEGCTFEGLGDDGVALYSKGIEILDKPADNQLRLADAFFSLGPGSQFLVYTPGSGQLQAQDLTVESVTRQPAGNGLPAHWLVTFSPGFTGQIATGGKQPWQNSQAFDRSRQHRDFVIRRNEFRHIRRYGAIIRAVRGAVEDNTFVQTSDSAITLQNEPRLWRNGLQSQDILIQRNKIIDCNFTASARERGCIHVAMRALSDPLSNTWDAPAPWRGHHGIIIRNNQITHWLQHAISVHGATDVIIRGNQIANRLPAPAGWDEQPAISVANVGGAVIRDNAVQGASPTTHDIKIIESDDIEIEANELAGAGQ